MKLYHYTTGAGLKAILESNEFHCSNILFLNDPSETYYLKNLINEVIENNDICKKVHNELYNKSLEDFYDNSKKYILSFCQNGDSLSMWNRYSKDDGYCLGIELNIDDLKQNNIEKDYYIEKLIVEYDKNKQLDIITRKILEYYDKLNQIGNYNYDYQGNPKECLSLDYTSDLLSLERRFKHSAYKDEEEVRLVVTVMDYCRDKYINGYKVSKEGIFIEYFKLKIFFENILREIICSPNSQGLKLQGLKSYINHNYGSKAIIIRKSEIPYRS